MCQLETSKVVSKIGIILLIKPGDELPTAGGYGVMICYNDEDLEKATQRIFEAAHATDN